jgi:hypothetical protein
MAQTTAKIYGKNPLRTDLACDIINIQGICVDFLFTKVEVRYGFGQAEGLIARKANDRNCEESS